MRLHLREVPGAAAAPVDEQKRRPRAAHEGPDPGASALVDPFFEAGQQVRRIRHVDRLWFDHCEFDGDKAEGMRSPALCPEKLETQTR